MGGRGGGGGGWLRNAFKTFLLRMYPAAFVTFMCRIQYSDDMWGNLQKDAECGGHTFTSSKDHLYFWLTKFERSQ